jgi:hypothetical protein
MNPLLGGLLGNLAGNYLSDKEDGTIWDKLGFSSANAQSPETMTDPMAQVGGQPHVNMPFTQPVTDKQVVQPFTPQIQNSVNQTPPVEEHGFMDKAGDFFGDEERMARMTIALNSMRLNPDASLATSMENKLKSLRTNKGNNKTAEQLRKMGRSDLAEAVESGAMDGTTAWTLAHKAPSAIQEKIDLYNKDPDAFAQM